MEIWLNPACSKCRTAVSELDATGADYTVRRYLDEPPTAAELEDVLARLGVDPWHIARTGDAKGLGVTLPPRDEAHRGDWLALMVHNPRLIQRPIITAGDGTTVVGRDAESLAKVIAAG
ncbi:arsenate reductase [Nocardioides cavernaquae]|uniref:Arsenate reductase n=1 Tax=Nocardioides cavernaquae TaxID=2321396 RepID=A0A3A5HC34_9ACTN|nr:arsenate reductase [Nocardioides cavernaquae]RJS48016.1 arsenate reductase [Nocardioides cavernaquae]RJS48017.1 arsenate reductase [Nocardioides cavernaquae]